MRKQVCIVVTRNKGMEMVKTERPCDVTMAQMFQSENTRRRIAGLTAATCHSAITNIDSTTGGQKELRRKFEPCLIFFALQRLATNHTHAHNTEPASCRSLQPGGENVFGHCTGPSVAPRKARTGNRATAVPTEMQVGLHQWTITMLAENLTLQWGNISFRLAVKMGTPPRLNTVGRLDRPCHRNFTDTKQRKQRGKAFPSPRWQKTRTKETNTEETKQQMKNNTHGHVWWRCKIEWHCLLIADPM